MATPHIESKKEDIKKIVLMPGDPLRAKFIAENFLDDYKLINTVRNMYGYTGKYKGHDVTIFASGMGMPSMGIYSYELFKFYDVDTIIRIGSAGAYTENLNLYDVLLVNGAYSESTYAKTQGNEQNNILYSNELVNKKIKESAEKLNINIKEGIVHSSDVFYKENDNFRELYDKYKCLACEMETFALFHNAKILNKKASAIVTISDNLVTHEKTTSTERQNSFTNMMKIALEAAIQL
ncbi:MAG: purine-nucleoside phosphorylase [Bacilli bacterium]|nr:purine-nucleoside phosphorylase [Bacilli bacterium]